MNRGVRRGAVALVLGATAAVGGQSLTDERPKFEGVSVKASKSGEPGLGLTVQPVVSTPGRYARD
jgi:hypothetical protein